MSKRILLSLFLASMIIPFSIDSVQAYPGYANQGGMHSSCASSCGEHCSGRAQRKPDPKFLEAVKPIRAANRQLFMALEKGDISTIQAAAKQFATEMQTVKDEEVKKHLERSARIATLMSTTKSYKEQLIGYNIIKHQTANYHPNTEQYNNRRPRLIVDSQVFTTIQKANEEMRSLISGLTIDTEKTIDSKITVLIKTLQSIKTPQLQEFTKPLLSTLTEMKSQKGILGKVAYKHSVMARVNSLSEMVQQKTA